MENELSIAIIGEGETEWFYFDSLRLACRYPFRIAPGIAQHSDIPHMLKLAEEYVRREYDHVVCLVDMDRLLHNPKEMESYRRLRRNASPRIEWIETSPCTEFWFLLHFLPSLPVRQIDSYEQLLPELQYYMPCYEKTKRYFRRIQLYKFLCENGDLQRAINFSKKLSALAEQSPEDRIAYSQMHRVLTLLSEMAGNDTGKEPTKTDFSISIGVKQQEILDFLANNADSDVKSIAKAIDLRLSRTRDYLKQLIEQGLITAIGDYRNKTYSINKS